MTAQLRQRNEPSPMQVRGALSFVRLVLHSSLLPKMRKHTEGSWGRFSKSG
jgi:hypothetical protein